MALFQRKRPRIRGNGSTEPLPLGLVVGARAIIVVDRATGEVTFDGVKAAEDEFRRNPRTVTFEDKEDQDNGAPPI